MATITTRSGKGSPLTNNEVDANFNNLNTDKAELSGATFTGQIVAPSLDISGDIDVDGTTNLDVVDIDGAVDMASTLTVTGEITANGGIALGDNDKATFGASDDLQIYHDGSNSYITDTGTGNLYVRASNELALTSAAGEAFFLGIADGSSYLYHNGSVKLNTTATGCDISGTATMDGLSVDNITIDGNEIDVSSGNLTLDVAGDIILDADGADVILKDGGTGFLEIDKDGDNARLKNPIADGDIKIQGIDGASTITALTLDMSAAGAATFNSTIAATGIDVTGTATMDSLTVGGTSAYPTATLSRDGGSAGTQGYLTTGFSAIGYSGGTGADTYMVSEHGFGFAVNAGTTALTITDTGNVGIGNAAPSTTLEVTGTGDAETGITATHARSGVGYTLLLNNTNNGANKGSGIKWQSGGFDTGAIITRSDATAASGDAPAYMTFHTSTDGSEDLAERARIDSSGRVGIGTSVAPHQKLTVTGVSAAVDGVLSNGILALTTGTGVIQDTRLLFGIVDDNYAWLQAADYGVAYRNIVMNPNGGNVLVGTTASNPTSSSVNVAGQEFSTTGGVRSTVASNAAATFNRKTDNGGIVLFRKDGTTVGSIGVEGGDALYIQSGTTSGSGLHFHPTSGTVRPARDGSTVDNAINLGTANRRFKDLYIAGLNVTASTYNKISSYFSGSYTSGFKFSDMNGGIWYDAASDDLTVSASHANSQLILESGGSERMRIDSSGNVGIGLDGGYKLDVLNTGGNVVSARFTSTATSSTEYGPLIVLSNDPNDTTRYLLAGGSSTVNRFVIYSNGNIKNQNNSYTGISDEKLKENIVDAGSQWDDIKALRVRKYSFKEENASEPTQIGVIAQEVEAAGMSGLVYETADQDTAEDGSFVDTGEVTKTMKYSILYMKAVKALQEAIDRIETLETRIAALEE